MRFADDIIKTSLEKRILQERIFMVVGNTCSISENVKIWVVSLIFMLLRFIPYFSLFVREFYVVGHPEFTVVFYLIQLMYDI